MSRGIYVALSGAIAQQEALDLTATNVANAVTPGYQRLRPVFKEALATAQGKTPGDPNLRYAEVDRTAVDTSAGAARVTNGALDAVLPRGAYLALATPRGERYTRAASLAVGDDGTVKTQSGSPVASDGGATIQARAGGGAVTLDKDGTVKQAGVALGKLKIVRFETPSALAMEGAGVLSAAQAGAATPATESLEVGSVEESNAQPVTEMTELMTASRAFDAMQKALETLGQVDQRLVTTVINPND